MFQNQLLDYIKIANRLYFLIFLVRSLEFWDDIFGFGKKQQKIKTSVLKEVHHIRVKDLTKKIVDSALIRCILIFVILIVKLEDYWM